MVSQRTTFSTVAHNAPPPAYASFLSASMRTPFRYRDRSMTTPASTDDAPEALWPLPRTARGIFSEEAYLIAVAMSSSFWKATILALLTEQADHCDMACSYSGCSEVMISPWNCCLKVSKEDMLSDDSAGRSWGRHWSLTKRCNRSCDSLNSSRPRSKTQQLFMTIAPESLGPRSSSRVVISNKAAKSGLSEPF